ncbi:unnamed protein product [Lactuca saligna]|uniref:Uncharacterized protein n=1 Tax=Lactuca saligna TaxID=75948 RepID=A0AA35YSA1_LACSI|nr:unnamed protein product [Lactuca saligna]
MKAQYETRSSKKIIAVKVLVPLEIESIIDNRFKMDEEIATVLNKKPTVLSKEPPKDLEKMTLGRIRKDDWSVAFQLREQPAVNFHRVSYIQEVRKMDKEIATIYNKNPIVLPKEPSKDLDKMNLGRI